MSYAPYESNELYESNKSYESITFEVEIGLDKPKELLYSENIDKIVNSLYQRKIKNCFKRRYEAMKILQIKKNFIIMEKSHYFVD